MSNHDDRVMGPCVWCGTYTEDTLCEECRIELLDRIKQLDLPGGNPPRFETLRPSGGAAEEISCGHGEAVSPRMHNAPSADGAQGRGV